MFIKNLNVETHKLEIVLMNKVLLVVVLLVIVIRVAVFSIGNQLILKNAVKLMVKMQMALVIQKK